MKRSGFFFGPRIPNRRVALSCQIALALSAALCYTIPSMPCEMTLVITTVLALTLGYLARPEGLYRTFLQFRENQSRLLFAVVFTLIYSTTVTALTVVCIALCFDIVVHFQSHMKQAIYLGFTIFTLTSISMIAFSAYYAQKYVE